MPRQIKRSTGSDTADSTTTLRLWTTEFLGLGATITDLTKRKDDLKKRLAGVVEEQGHEDEKGSVWLDLPEPIQGVSQLKRERRVSQSADPERLDTLLAEKGLMERCYRQVPVLDEDEVMAAHYEGLITAEEIDACFPKKVTYAFVPVKGR